MDRWLYVWMVGQVHVYWWMDGWMNGTMDINWRATGNNSIDGWRDRDGPIDGRTFRHAEGWLGSRTKRHKTLERKLWVVYDHSFIHCNWTERRSLASTSAEVLVTFSRRLMCSTKAHRRDCRLQCMVLVYMVEEEWPCMDDTPMPCPSD